MQVVMFSKHLAELPIAQAGEAIRDLGFDGADLTVRPGGHVRPEAVQRDLPAAAAALTACGLSLPMITTAITSAREPDSDPIFREAAALGIRRLKLGYWPYRPFGQLRQQLDAARRELDEIERLAAQTGVCACIHTHSGNYLSATAAGMQALLTGRDPDCVGAYLDPGHMAVEGGAGGWRQGLDLLQSSIRLIAVKDFGWSRRERPPGEPKRAEWRPEMVPLAEGIVPWDEVFARLRQIGFDDVVSVHSEYQGSHSWRDLSLDELLQQTREDLRFLRGVIERTGPGTAG